MTIDAELLKRTLESAPEGVVVCEARSGEWQVVFANAAMEQLTGYQADALVGRDLGLLQAQDTDQEGLAVIRRSLSEGVSCRTTLRNYRRDGSMFWNDIRVTPFRGADGAITHFASFHREGTSVAARSQSESTPDATESFMATQSMSTQSMLAYLRDDKLTGLLRRQYFEELVKRDWSLAQRESRRLSLLIFDLDNFLHYRDVFGRPGAEQTFRRIARVVAGCFRRASDLCGRFDEDQIAALTTGLDLSQAAQLAEAVLGRIRDLSIHHPRSAVLRYLTASAGVVSLVPPHDMEPTRMYLTALQALQDAKELGRNRVVSRECD